jgi:Ca2+-binding RTX toxin-like protein
MALPVANAIPRNADPRIDGLLQGSAWTFGTGPRTLTYSFNLNFEIDELGNLIPADGGTWNDYPALASAVAKALASWAAVANISFAPISSGSYIVQSTADLAFGLTGSDLVNSLGASALGFFPDPGFSDDTLSSAGYTRIQYPRPEGDVLLDNFYQSFFDLSDGREGLWTIIHEIGHALGLKHPFDDGGNNRPTFATGGIAQFDDQRYTVMSYTPLEAAFTGGYAASPMPLDILAIQQIYGANLAYRTGDDTYMASLDGALRTLWDAGGIDTIDVSAIVPGPLALVLDLRPGAVMELSDSTVLAIAYNTIIENAIGGLATDRLIGNDAANRLDGGPGADSLAGGGGDDTYVVDDSGDIVDETAPGSGGTDHVIASLRWTLGVGLENLTLALGASTGIGNSLVNRIIGNSANNRLDGGTGDDTLVGEAGNDTYLRDSAGDTITEADNAGLDTVYTSLDYVLPAGVEHLRLTGTGHLQGTGNVLANRIVGTPGNNRLEGLAGSDTLYGGAGNDTYLVDSASDTAAEAVAMPELLLADVRSLDPGDYRASNDSAVVAADGSVTAFVYGNSQIHAWMRATGTVQLLSSNATGTPGNAQSFFPLLSGDGRYAAFSSWASNLVDTDTNDAMDVFRKDLATGAIVRASVGQDGSQANAASNVATALSADGRLVAFISNASNLVAADPNGDGADVFVKDLQTGAITIASTGNQGETLGASLMGIAISANNRHLFFTSPAAVTPGDTNAAPDLFRKDLQTGELRLVSSTSNGTPASLVGNASFLEANGSQLAGISSDGRYAAFTSVADNLVPGDTNQTSDLFVKDLQTGSIVRASTGTGGVQANHGSNGGSLSADGRYVLFNSVASNLSPLDTDEGFDVYMKDLATGQTALLTAPAFGAKQANLSQGYSMTADGSLIVFSSWVSNLVDDDTNNGSDVFTIANPLFDPGGIDQVIASTSHRLAPFIETLTLTGNTHHLGVGNAMPNTITAEGGSDTLSGGPGNDTLDGGAGIDLADYSAADGAVVAELWRAYALNDGDGGQDSLRNFERLRGSAFHDILAGDGGANHLDGDAGNDGLYAADGTDTLVGGAGNDTLDGGGGTDTADYSAAPGPVTAELWRSFALVDGHGGQDALWNIERLLGSGFSDLLAGGAGNEFFSSGAGNDGIYAAAGIDTLIGGAGNDTLDGGPGIDVVDYSAASGPVTAELWRSFALVDGTGGQDALWNIEGVIGSAFADILAGGAGNEVLVGNAGNDGLYAAGGIDTLMGGSGNDTIDGGPGIDAVDYGAATGPVTAELWRSFASNDGQGGQDALWNIEYLLGSAFSDLLAGTNADNYLGGQNGADQLYAAGGNDTLAGGLGNDILNGGAGLDVFLFNTAPGAGNLDTVQDFVVADDTVWLENAVFTALVATGPLAAGQLRAGAGVATAADGNDFILYNSSTGALFYDADGSGTGAVPVQFALLGAGLGLTEADLVAV